LYALLMMQSVWITLQRYDKYLKQQTQLMKN